jgi:glycosyltransferase involved in cell wall biosynthesis
MLISILTPSFNQGRYIDEITGPVLSQGYSRVEYILADDASTDATLDIRKKHENRRAGWGMLG